MVKQAYPVLTVAVSSRALFDLEKSHEVYEEEGVVAYEKYQIAHENVPLAPGPAFHTVDKLLKLASVDENRRVEVVLLSRNSADTGLRVFNSIAHYSLPITRAAFTSGASPYIYNDAFSTDLFLSAHNDDVRLALKSGIAAATILPGQLGGQSSELRIAFDGDAVIFSDEAERIYQDGQLPAFIEHEVQTANQPLPGGPFKPFLEALLALQVATLSKNSPNIRTALITARSAPTHERVVRTLRAWGIHIDEAVFLGGLAKGAFLKAFAADIFFDDQKAHCISAAEHVPAAHVPHGVTND